MSCFFFHRGQSAWNCRSLEASQADQGRISLWQQDTDGLERLFGGGGKGVLCAIADDAPGRSQR